MALDRGVDVGAHRVEVEGEVGQVDRAVVGGDRAQRVDGRPAVAPVRVGRGRPGVTVFLDVGFEVGERAVVALDRQHEPCKFRPGTRARSDSSAASSRSTSATMRKSRWTSRRASHRLLAVAQRVQRAGPQRGEAPRRSRVGARRDGIGRRLSGDRRRLGMAVIADEAGERARGIGGESPSCPGVATVQAGGGSVALDQPVDERPVGALGGEVGQAAARAGAVVDVDGEPHRVLGAVRVDRAEAVVAGAGEPVQHGGQPPAAAAAPRR